MEEKRYTTKHKVIIEKREKLFITGILEVMRFDEDEIVTETDLGMLLIKGENLHVNALNLEKGELEIDGKINGMNYAEEKIQTKNILEKIFK
ncbi:MAG: sporulation protein YabP [Defluviitaleaceae bacterium]|nr:sporulation protein YabP [Defluviitaleaceae bacterium]